jgi:hypothetical protein
LASAPVTLVGLSASGTCGKATAKSSNQTHTQNGQNVFIDILALDTFVERSVRLHEDWRNGNKPDEEMIENGKKLQEEQSCRP